MISRRQFVQQSGMALTAASLLKGQSEESKEKSWPILFFEKPIQSLSYQEIGDKLAALGFQGIEATIRPKGHIEPQNAAKEVPKMRQALETAGLNSVIATTRVLTPDKDAKELLKILRDNGITQFRTDYYRYRKGGQPMKEAQGFHDDAKALAELCAEMEMQALYQIHSGGRFAGSLLWDAALIFEGINPDHFGIAYDLRHGKTDCGLSWKIGVDLIRDNIRALYVKDARWGGERSDKLINVPLDTGFVDREVFEYARQGLNPMPLSLHLEFGKHTIYPPDQTSEVWPLIEKEITVLKEWRKAIS